MPNYLVMYMVSSAAFHGDYALKPFNFKNYRLKSLLLTRDDENVPYERFEPDFTSDNCLREYMSQYQSNGLIGKNAVLPFTYDEFKTGYTNFQWNLSDNRKRKNAGPNPRANVKIDVAFAETTKEAMVMVFYGVFESTIQVFANDEVLVNGI